MGDLRGASGQRGDRQDCMAAPSFALVIPLVVALLGGALSVEAQSPGRVYRVGSFSSGTREQTLPLLTALEDGLRRLGYVEGQNVRFEYRFGGGREERFAEFAAELVRLNVDVIVAGSNHAVAAAKQATGTLPIVMTITADPVGSGFVESLSRPGGNVTGLSVDVTPEVAGKRLALLKEAVPHLKRVAVLWEPIPSAPEYLRATEDAAARLGVTLRAIEIHSVRELERAFAAVLRERIDGLFVFLSALALRNAESIANFAARHRLPAVYGTRTFAERGGLMSYGVDLPDLYRRAATYVDKVLRGARPADLPVEQPTKFEFVINLKTAKALGLTIPQSLLLQADEVIQ